MKQSPVLTTHGNPPVAIGGPPVATGGGKLGYMEAFPSVATGGPPMDHRWKIRKFRKWKFRSKFLETGFTTRNTFRRIKAKQNGIIIRTGSEFSVNPVCSFRSCPKNIFHSGYPVSLDLIPVVFSVILDLSPGFFSNFRSFLRCFS